jgi:cytochrome c-type biogenesis protein CcmE
VRLVIALSVAAVLAVFLLYTSIAGGGNPSLAPSELAGRTGTVQLAGVVVGPVRGDSYAGGLRFGLKDIGSTGTAKVAVRYTGSVPDLFKVGRHIVVDGHLKNGMFVAEPGSMITKCPSKYAPKKTGDSA